MRARHVAALAALACAGLWSPCATSASPTDDLDDDMVISEVDEGSARKSKRKRRQGKGGASTPTEGKEKTKEKKKKKKGKTEDKAAKKAKKAKKTKKEPEYLILRSEPELIEAREQHPALLLMVYSDLEPNSQAALPQFRRLAALWAGPGNVTTAIAESENLDATAKVLGIRSIYSTDGLPRYGLFLQGLDGPVRYRGGWSKNVLGQWLHHQLALRPAELESAAQLSSVISRQAGEDNGHGLTVVGLVGAPEQRRLFRSAVHAAGAFLSVATGGAGIADQLGAPFPSVLIASKHAEAPWALLSGAEDELTEERIRNFVATRGLPPRAVPLGYEYQNRYDKQVFSDRRQMGDDRLIVMLFHRLKKLPKTDQHEESRQAVQVFEDMSLDFEGRALFATFDFFDNDPTDVEKHYDVKQSNFPTVIVMHGDGRRWHLQGPFKERAVDNLVERALRESNLPRDPPDDWETLPRHKYVLGLLSASHDEL